MKYSVKKACVAGTLALSLAHIDALAQSPGFIPVGPFDLTPTLTIEVEDTDNFFLRSGDDEVSTTVTTITPAFGMVFDNGVTGISLSYELEDASHSSLSSEDYTNQSTELTIGSTLGDFQRITLTGSKAEFRDAEGDTDDPLATGLDEYEDEGYAFNYRFATDATPLGFSAGVEEVERTYTNNRAITSALDYEETQNSIELTWRATPSIRWGVQFTDTDVEFDTNSARDSSEETYAVTLNLSPSSIVSGDIAVGQTERTLDRDDSSSETEYWDINIEWAMLSYSTLALSSSNSFEEAATDDGDFTTSRSVGIEWRHDWTDLWQTTFSFEDGNVDFENSSRSDDTQEYSVGLNYQARRWLNIGLSVTESSRDSTESANDFDSTTYGLVTEFTL